AQVRPELAATELGAGEAHLGEIAVVRRHAVQERSVEPGAREIDRAQLGVLEADVAQVGLDETDALHAHAVEIGADEHGARRHEPAQRLARELPVLGEHAELRRRFDDAGCLVGHEERSYTQYPRSATAPASPYAARTPTSRCP